MKIILMQCPVLNYKILLVELAVKLIKIVYLNESVRVQIVAKATGHCITNEQLFEHIFYWSTMLRLWSNLYKTQFRSIFLVYIFRILSIGGQKKHAVPIQQFSFLHSCCSLCNVLGFLFCLYLILENGWNAILWQWNWLQI